MAKSVEREAIASNPLATAPAIAVQFFLIPLLVVGATALVYVGFRSLLTTEKSASEYLTDIRSGGSDRRWPAAYELSRLMADPAFVKREQATLGPELVKTFRDLKAEDSAGWCAYSSCPPVRRYLALALGRLTAPLPGDAVPALTDALADADSETVINAIWALGAIGDPSLVPQLEEKYGSDDAGVRKMVVYALGALPADAGAATLVKALDDATADVQWNAAVALARHGRHDGVQVLRRMLDREYVQRTVTRQQQNQDEIDPVSEVMISGLRAVAALKESALSDPVKALSQNDSNLKVRQAALETLKALG
jgi:HEAT repeat protein